MRASFLLTALLMAASPCAAAPASAPLVHVRFLGPPGMQVAFFQGTGYSPAWDFPAPVVAGLRPGYMHRVRLSALPGRPGLMLFPTVEIKGALCLPSNLSTGKYPIPVPITEQDIDRIVSGRYITKVVYLEDPEKAQAVSTTPENPMEFELSPDRDIMWEAHQLGRPMLMVRIGTRIMTDKELAEQTVPQTVLLPGKTMMSLPPVPPCLPWASVRIFDPILGPKPATEECLRDGGDLGWPAGIDGSEQLRGVEPADTVAEFRDSTGTLRVAKSNKVCICVPRFAVLRTELPLLGYDVMTAPAGTQLVQEQVQINLKLPPLQAQQHKQPGEFDGRMKPSANLAVQGPVPLSKLCILDATTVAQGLGEFLDIHVIDRITQVQRTQLLKQMEFAHELSIQHRTSEVHQIEGVAVLGKVKGLDVVSATLETRDLTICCNEAPRPPDKPLVLWKWADRCAAQVGDVVTFTLKYSNHGGRPITDVAVVDSLTGRLEYVPGSAKASRDAVFTTQDNEAGSQTLRWEISGDLLPGQSGVVSFQAKVR